MPSIPLSLFFVRSETNRLAGYQTAIAAAADYTS